MKLFINKIENEPGQSIAVDDMLLVKDVPATAGSKMLENFIPLFDAEVVDRVKKAGYAVAGKTNVGEFGLDIMGETSAFGSVTDEHGCAVGASAKAVADGNVLAALNVDLNGAPRRGAAVCNVTFLKPTYGTVSRYGVIPCACSGEQVGVTARNSEDAAKILSVIAGHDEKDGTSLMEPSYEYPMDIPVAGLRIGVPKEYRQAADDEMQKQVDRAAKQLKAAGAVVEEVSFKEAKLAKQAWQILLSAETCNNLSRYDGVKFGYRSEQAENIDDLYVNSRTESMGFLTKLTILYGSDVLSKDRYKTCYDKALRVRRAVKNALDELFKKYDCILMPPCGKQKFTKAGQLEEAKAVYEQSLFTAAANLTGIPAIVTTGVQLMADNRKDNLLLSIAGYLEKGGHKQ